MFNPLAKINHRFTLPGLRTPLYQQPLLAFLVVAVIVALFIWRSGSLPLFGVVNPTVNNQKVEIAPAKKTATLNREFTFPLKDAEGKEVAKVKYFIEKAELRDEVVTQGKRANAVRGRTFLVFNLEISNEHNQPIKINARDYIRVIIDSDDKKPKAPDTLHSDPVEVLAIASKQTRVGLAIDENFKGLKINVGEINGEKITIDLNFK